MLSEASLNYSLLILRYNTKYHTYGAVDWDRTSDLLVTNELLCQLSYNGVRNHHYITAHLKLLIPLA